METEVADVIAAKVLSLPELELLVKQWKKQGLAVVFTNGVFDIVHTGHLSYLGKARQLGNKLVVAINADSSVKRLKGPERPVNSQTDRATLLASMFFIDAVVVFDEDTPLQVIKTLLPDVLVKGADYSTENIVGAREVMDNGGEVKTITFVNGYSSTSIINRIKTAITPQ